MRNCPLCSGKQTDVIGVQRYCLEATSALPTETQIAACTDCGFVFARSNKSAENYQNYYAEQTRYESSVNASGSGEYALDKKRISDLVDALTEDLALDASVLDIGAAKGGVLVELQRRGYKQLYGVDASATCVESITSHGIDGCVGKLEDNQWPLDARQFDLVILSHVLEHVFNVTAGLASAKRRLAPNGTIYVEVPDASRYTVDGFPPYYFFDPEHINHFDLASLRVMAAKQGMTVIRWQDRQLNVGSAATYPALGVWLTAQGHESRTEVEVNTRDTVRRYINNSRAALMAMPNMAELDELSVEQTPVVLWGAGSHAKRLLANSPLATANLIAIIDSDSGKHGKLLNGVEICPVQHGLQRAQETNATIVVAIAVNADPVLKELESMVNDLSIISI